MAVRASILAAMLTGCASQPVAPRVATVPASRASAPAAKPVIAILGLAPESGADPVVARTLTASLRARAASASSPFQLATGRAADVDLDERKDIGTCANEAAACMAAIGADLDVALLIYGHVRHRADADGGGDELDVHLMDVRAHVNRRTATAPIAGDARSADATAAAVFAQLADGVIPAVGTEARGE